MKTLKDAMANASSMMTLLSEEDIQALEVAMKEAK